MSGAAARTGCRQSIPSSNIESCAALSDTLPLCACGQIKRPRSKRLAIKQRPVPSHHNTLKRKYSMRQTVYGVKGWPKRSALLVLYKNELGGEKQLRVEPLTRCSASEYAPTLPSRRRSAGTCRVRKVPTDRRIPGATQRQESGMSARLPTHVSIGLCNRIRETSYTIGNSRLTPSSGSIRVSAESHFRGRRSASPNFREASRSGWHSDRSSDTTDLGRSTRFGYTHSRL